MKVVLISIVDISKKNGQGIYAKKTIESIIYNLKKRNINYYLFIPEPSLNIDKLNIEQLCQENVIFLRKKIKARNYLWHILIQLELFVKLYKTSEVDAIIYSLKPTMIAPILLSKIRKLKIYLLLEGLSIKTVKTLSNKIISNIGLHVLQSSIKKATKIYPAYISSQFWVQNISNNKPTELIYCGVDFKTLKPAPKKGTDCLTIGYVGSFRKVHMLKKLVEVSAALNIHLKLIGNGKEYNSINTLIQKLDLKNIKLYGELEQKEFRNIFSECDLMWAATEDWHWGVPIKSFEYLACNKKIIVTYKKDFQFIEDEKFGYIIKKTSYLDIFKLLETIKIDYKNNRIFDNKFSRDYIKKKNNWENFGEKILLDIK